jgi:hypothetical protein
LSTVTLELENFFFSILEKAIGCWGWLGVNRCPWAVQPVLFMDDP